MPPGVHGPYVTCLADGGFGLASVPLNLFGDLILAGGKHNLAQRAWKIGVVAENPAKPAVNLADRILLAPRVIFSENFLAMIMTMILLPISCEIHRVLFLLS